MAKSAAQLLYGPVLVHFAPGIIDTNAYIIGENATQDMDLQGLFPITSIINHACTANTVCFSRDGEQFTVRAATHIKRGEELTTNYLHQ